MVGMGGASQVCRQGGSAPAPLPLLQNLTELVSPGQHSPSPGSEAAGQPGSHPFPCTCQMTRVCARLPCSRVVVGGGGPRLPYSTNTPNPRAWAGA